MADADDGRATTVTLEALGGFRFRAAFEASGTELIMDEPEPLGEGAGPAASEVLSAAVGNCLSASLLFCLQKSDVSPGEVVTDVTTTMTRSDEGRLRIGGTEVEIPVDLDEEGRELSRPAGTNG